MYAFSDLSFEYNMLLATKTQKLKLLVYKMDCLKRYHFSFYSRNATESFEHTKRTNLEKNNALDPTHCDKRCS